MSSDHTDVRSSAAPADGSAYVVVARRYRPQVFDELVGQHVVAQALRNAITANRVGHAYLFAGARGVGKTSTARILAKSLNCVSGPTPTPCGTCDVCLSIATGDDVDVLEIDGASNRGIDEIRQLRANAGVRPSRSHFKIYIIDEVHMLTKEAFNALLKTLEEPPGHVKFIFCTTAPEKIPITVLSRCQRFDFAPVEVPAIVQRLEQIVQSEGGQAEREALEIIARRAAGSLRDSQSLLEQLLAQTAGTITVDRVHGLLGTAHSGRVQALAQRLMGRDAGGALAELDALLQEGVDVGQLAEQLLITLRDMMAAGVGCPPGLMLAAAPGDYPQLAADAKRWGLETLLAAAQILDQALARMRVSVHARMLVEMALVRIAQLDRLDDLADLIARLQPLGAAPGGESSGGSAAPPAAVDKKKVAAPVDRPDRQPLADAPEPLRWEPPVASPPTPHLSPATGNALEIWRRALSHLDGLTADTAGHFDAVAISAPNQLAVTFKARYSSSKTYCERPDCRAQIEHAVEAVSGASMRVEFRLVEDTVEAAPVERTAVSARQQVRAAQLHPWVQRAVELFGAEIDRVELPATAPRSPEG